MHIMSRLFASRVRNMIFSGSLFWIKTKCYRDFTSLKLYGAIPLMEVIVQILFKEQKKRITNL